MGNKRFTITGLLVVTAFISVGLWINSFFQAARFRVPGLGVVTEEVPYDWYRSRALSISVFGGQERSVMVCGNYEFDSNREEYHTAIKNFLALDPPALRDAEKYIFQYYQNCNSIFDPGEPGFVSIAKPEDVWSHIQIGSNWRPYSRKATLRN